MFIDHFTSAISSMLTPVFTRLMSRMSVTTAAPFTGAVVSAMRKLFPEALADHSFDNTGLLLEAPFDATRRQRNSVLLTVDLTKAVADEAISRRDSCIVSYHPIIFRGLKSLTLANTQQQSLLRLAAAGISVYSPHTAVDAAPGGLGDWLADIVSGEPASKTEVENTREQTIDHANRDTSERPVFMLQHHPSQALLQEQALSLGSSHHKRWPIKKVSVKGQDGAGMGRVVWLNAPVPLSEIINRVSLGLGNPKAFPIAIPQGKEIKDITIQSIAVCAGSGGHLFSELEKDGEEVDLYFTGELSHHEALAAVEKGKCVVALFHSNTERGFLHGIMKPKLEAAIREEWKEARNDEDLKQNQDLREALADEDVEVHVSEVDRDPYGIMIRNVE